MIIISSMSNCGRVGLYQSYGDEWLHTEVNRAFQEDQANIQMIKEYSELRNVMIGQQRQLYGETHQREIYIGPD